MTIAATKQILMSDMFVNNTNVGERFLKTTAQDFSQVEVMRGYYFAGSTKRENITPTNTHYSVITTGENYLSIKDLDIMSNIVFDASADFEITMHGFVDISNSNAWSYVADTQYPMGTPLNTTLVNDKSTTLIELGVAATVTGLPDYLIFDDTIDVDTQGNRNNTTQVKSSLFENGRVLIIAPNSKALIKTVISGPDTATASLTTMFYFKEFTAKQFAQEQDI